MRYLFKSTDECAMIQGCMFRGGFYATNDAARAESLRKARGFGTTIIELTEASDPPPLPSPAIEKPPAPVKPVPKPKPKKK